MAFIVNRRRPGRVLGACQKRLPVWQLSFWNHLLRMQDSERKQRDAPTAENVMKTSFFGSQQPPLFPFLTNGRYPRGECKPPPP